MKESQCPGWDNILKLYKKLGKGELFIFFLGTAGEPMMISKYRV